MSVSCVCPSARSGLSRALTGARRGRASARARDNRPRCQRVCPPGLVSPPASLVYHGGLGAPGPKGRDAMRRRGEAASLSCRVARRVAHFITVVRNLATGTASPSVSGYIGETLWCNVETRQAASGHAGEDIYATVTDCPARFSWRYDLSIHRKLNFTRSQQISGGQRKGRSSRPGLTRDICAEPTQTIGAS